MDDDLEDFLRHVIQKIPTANLPEITLSVLGNDPRSYLFNVEITFCSTHRLQ